MKNTKLLISVLILIILGCKKDEVVPVFTRIEFELSPLNGSYEYGDNISATITRLGNYDFETEAIINFYISKDNSYSSDDILINSNNSLSTTFTADSKDKFFSLNLNNSDVAYGNYYLIAKLKSSSSPNASIRYCNTPIKISTPLADITLTGFSFYTNGNYTIHDTSTTFLTDVDFYSKILFDNKLGFSQNIYYQFYLSTDNKLDATTDTKIYNSYTGDYSNGSLYANSSIPASTAEGTYYMIVIANYTYNNKARNSNTLSMKINVKKFVDHISITGINVPKTTYIRTAIFTSTLTITNENLKSQQLSVTMYASVDKSIDYYTDNLGSGTYIINPGMNVITISSSLYDTGTGSYYLLARTSYYAQSGSYSSFIFVGPSIQVVPPNVSISGISLFGTKTVDVGDIFGCTITTVSDIQSSNSQYLSIETFLSVDNTWSVDDISAGTSTPYYTKGSYENNVSRAVPSMTPDGTYYVIIRYQKTGETTYTDIVSSDTITVKPASAVLFRNTQNTSYSTLYLFVDDIYVKTLDCYSSMSSPSCSAFKGTYCNYYSSSTSYYKFFGSDGSHTFKLRSTNNIGTGATLFNGNFNASSSACVSVDVD